MKYLILFLTAIFLYSCVSPITSMDQVEIYNYDMIMQVDGDSYRGYNITEEDILDFGVKKEVELDSMDNRQIVKYVNGETGNTLSELVFYRKPRISTNLILDLGRNTDFDKNLNNYIDSIYVYYYDSTNVRKYYQVARLYSPNWQKVETFNWSLTKKVGEYAPIFDYSTQPKDSLDKWNIKSQDKQYCDFSKVVQKVWKESKDKGGERRYKCKIFINDDGQFTQMYCSRNIHNFDLKLIMDCLISFDYSHFLDCMKSKEDGYTRDVWFTLGGSHYVPQRLFIPSPEEGNQ